MLGVNGRCSIWAEGRTVLFSYEKKIEIDGYRKVGEQLFVDALPKLSMECRIDDKDWIVDVSSIMIHSISGSLIGNRIKQPSTDKIVRKHSLSIEDLYGDDLDPNLVEITKTLSFGDTPTSETE
jgi:hypothetical protein